METIKKTGPEIGESQIASFEETVGCSLPSDYREFLLQFNGGVPSPFEFDFGGDSSDGSDVLVFYSLGGEDRNNLYKILDVYEGRIPGELLPIASDSLGNETCIGLEGKWRGQILFWDHERLAREDDEGPGYENLIFISDSFQEFLDSLYDFKE